MDNYSYILFNLPALAFFMSIYFLWKRAKCSRSICMYMSLVLFMMGVSIALFAQYFNPIVIEKQYWGFDFAYCLTSCFCAPIYFLFINKFAATNVRANVNMLAFLPSIIFAVLFIAAELIMTDVDRHAYVSNIIQGRNIQIEASMAYDLMVLIGNKVYKIFVPLQAVLVMVYGEFRLNRYIKMLNEYYHYVKAGDVTRIRGIHTLTILIAALCVFVALIPIYETRVEIWLVLFVVIIEIVLVSFITAYVTQLEFSAENLVALLSENRASQLHAQAASAQAVSPGSSSSVSGSQYASVPRTTMGARSVSQYDYSLPQQLIDRIDGAMEKECLYLNPDLSLNVLAEHIGTNRTYVSKAIKDAKGCNFSDYVNRFRLDYAIEMMRNTPKESIVVQNIAVQCGCGSIQTFYRYFKLFFNQTPSQWIDKNK